MSQQGWWKESERKEEDEAGKMKKEVVKQIQIKDIPSPSIFSHTESRIILFSYNPAQNQQSPYQIMLLQQTSKKSKTFNQSLQLQQMMNNVGLESQVKQKLFLKRINNEERQWLTKQLNDLHEYRQIAFKQGLKDRLQRRRNKFEQSTIRRQSMNMASSEVIAERKIKVVNMNSLMQNYNKKEMIQLGNQQFEFEDLSQTNEKQEYYALIKKRVNTDQYFPHLAIPETLLTKIEFQAQAISEQEAHNEDFDSNDQDNPDFDYPDEQMQSDGSRSSQGIIRDYDDQDYEQRSNASDEEQLYNKYLRRVRRKQQQMQREEYYQQND